MKHENSVVGSEITLHSGWRVRSNQLQHEKKIAYIYDSYFQTVQLFPQLEAEQQCEPSNSTAQK